MQEFPEADRAGWFPAAVAKRKILQGQAGFLDRLQEKLGLSEPVAVTLVRRGYRTPEQARERTWGSDERNAATVAAGRRRATVIVTVEPR